MPQGRYSDFRDKNQHVLKTPIVRNGNRRQQEISRIYGKNENEGHLLGGETWKSGEYQRMIKPTSL